MADGNPNAVNYSLCDNGHGVVRPIDLNNLKVEEIPRLIGIFLVRSDDDDVENIEALA